MASVEQIVKLSSDIAEIKRAPLSGGGGSFYVRSTDALAVSAGKVPLTLEAGQPGTIGNYRLPPEIIKRVGGTSNTEFEFTASIRCIFIRFISVVSAADGDNIRYSLDVEMYKASAAVPAWTSVTDAGFEFGPPVSQQLITGQSAALTTGDDEFAGASGTYIAQNIEPGDRIRAFTEALVGDQLERQIGLSIDTLSSTLTET